MEKSKTKVPITVFNQNISYYINSTKKGQIIYLTQYKKPVAVLIGVDKLESFLEDLMDEKL